MPFSARLSMLCVGGLLASSLAGCSVVPQSTLRQSQLRSQQLFAQNHELSAQLAQSSEQQHQLAAQLDIANQRIANLNNERSELRDRYVSFLRGVREQGNPLSGSINQRFQALAERYPDFEFDPDTGVSKFHADILFGTGSDQLRSSAFPILKEFAEIMNDAGANGLNILVVGHTDDKPIRRTSTQARHATNWHLSTNRANSVALTLQKFGVKPARMGVAGYSKYQPLVANANENARQRNRRVEIFVLAPDAMASMF